MNNPIIFIIIGALVNIIYSKIRNFIFKKAFNQITGVKMENNNVKLNCSVGNIYQKDEKEVFQIKKLKKAIVLNSSVEWIKDLVSIFNLRKLIIYFVIISCIFGYGYFKGRGNTPIQINLDYNKEFKMKLDSHYLVKPKYSSNLRIEDKNGNLVKDIKAKDFPLLANQLRPIGFCLEPIAIVGGSIGEKTKGFEGGAGVSFIKYWKCKLDTFLTNRGIYIGTSYSITENSGAGLGIGKGFIGDNRVILYYKFKF